MASLVVALTVPTVSLADFGPWEETSPGSMQWRDPNTGLLQDRFMPYEDWKKQVERAAYGAENGGGAVPKGFSEQALKGKDIWEDLQKTSNTGAKQAEWTAIKGEAATASRLTKVLPLLKFFGNVTLVGTAWEIGWHIGSGGESFWSFLFGGQDEGLEPPLEGSYTYAYKLYPRDIGEEWAGGEGYALSQPQFQLQFKTSPGGSTLWEVKPSNYEWYGYGGTCPAEPSGLRLMPTETFEVITSHYIEKQCKDAEGEYRGTYTAIWGHSLYLQCIAGQQTEGCAAHEYDEERSESAPEALEGPEATEAMEECFSHEIPESAPEATGAQSCRLLPAWWFTHDPEAQEDSTGTKEIADPLEIEIPKPEPTELYPEYDEKLEELGLIPAPHELDFSEVDPEKEYKAVIVTYPGWETTVEEESEVEVWYNPDYRVIPSIEKDTYESYEDYAKRLEEEELKPKEKTLTESATDPETGPNGASYTVPKEGTAVKPETEVIVETNPATAPYPTGSSWSPPAIKALSLPTFSGSFCEVFPFGLFCWYGEALTNWGSEGTCPEFGIPWARTVVAGNDLTIDFCQLEPAMEVVRPVLVLLGTISIVLFVSSMAAGGGGSTEP